MVPGDINPYESSLSASVSAVPHTTRRWLVLLVIGACVYYGISAATLPFTNWVWFGEVPPLALLQLPKAILKDGVQTVLLSLLPVLGLSRGSPSPDYIATHGPALLCAVAVPALLIITLIGVLSRDCLRVKLLGAVFGFATVDTFVTFWFDAVSNLKLYNGSFF